ncbi:unnamed protein product [Peronospora effusa]|nr:unnamed protein product [Peronospora effusa]
MAGRPYQRVAPSAHHHESDGNDSDGDSEQQQCDSRSQRPTLWKMRLNACLWMAVAGLVAYGTNFFRVVFTDLRVKRGFFQVALICTGVTICIIAYLVIYLPCIKRIQLKRSIYCPKIISAAAIMESVAALCYICALWPVWGLLTPGLLGLLLIGALMTTHFLPSI